MTRLWSAASVQKEHTAPEEIRDRLYRQLLFEV
jgi:hypothetical protein